MYFRRLERRRRPSTALHLNRGEAAIRSDRFRFGILCVLAYVALSWAVRFDMRLGDQIASLVYPLDTFSMYSGLPGESVSHLLVRDDQGRVHRVTDFQTFACSGPVARSSSPCANDVAIAYHYDDLAHYIADHPGPGDRQVDVIDRTWRIRPGGGPEPVADCLVAHCKVSR